MNKNNFMPIVEKICSFPPSALDRTEEDGKELLNLCRTLMDMVNIPSNAEIYEIPLMKNNQVVICFFLENDDEKEYCLNAGHWLDDTISMKLEAYGKETHEYDIEMYTAFESLPLDYFENHEKEKILYFEGAGCVPCNDVENCRIRTAFTNKEGKKIYIEFIQGCKVTKVEYSKNGRKLKNPKYISENGYLTCDFCFYITDDKTIDDCNYSRVKCDDGKNVERNMDIEKVKYTKENILQFVNKYCNADFDKIVVLDNLAGFRAMNDSYGVYSSYNYGDEFVYNKDLTKRRIEKVKELEKKFAKIFNEPYSNASFYIENDKLMCHIYVSKERLAKAGLDENDRTFMVEV